MRTQGFNEEGKITVMSEMGQKGGPIQPSTPTSPASVSPTTIAG